MIPAGLQPNETYTFAVAAYDAEHKLISELGQSAGPVAALLPLPLLHLWCHLALTAAHLGVANITHLAAGVVLPHFIISEPDCPAWEANPLDRQTVHRSVLTLSRPVRTRQHLSDFVCSCSMCIRRLSQLSLTWTLLHSVSAWQGQTGLSCNL